MPLSTGVPTLSFDRAAAGSLFKDVLSHSSSDALSAVGARGARPGKTGGWIVNLLAMTMLVKFQPHLQPHMPYLVHTELLGLPQVPPWRFR